jgi:DNA helicase-2/ATP-dependent DNA helicase PcrA
MIAYLRLMVNPSDREALARIVSAPPCGIGEKTLGMIAGINYECSDAEFAGLPKKVQNLYGILKKLSSKSLIEPLDKFIYSIATETGFKNYLLDGTPEGEGRWENVKELMTVAEQVQKNFDARLSIVDDKEQDSVTNNQDSENSVLESFLEQVALVQDTDQIDSSSGVVTLMTMHAAKGLEFKTVFITGVEEGIFPHSRALMDPSEMEEERRLCYVGITRAKERLYMLYAGERNLYGRFQSNEKSRFIEHIPEHLLDII